MKVLYLSWTGLTEPLGRSQVLGYLKHLSQEHTITVLSMEKQGDKAEFETIEEICSAHGISWTPLRYHKRPRILARPLDLATFTVAAMWQAWKRRPDIVHARSYLPSFAAAIIRRTLRIPFIFDMRSLWPEELVVSGRLRSDSMLHRAIKAAERHLLRRASITVSLTSVAVEYLKSQDPFLHDRKFVVIPTCADLESFTIASGARPGMNHRIGTIGSVISGWFWLPWLMEFFRAFDTVDRGSEFHIVTRDNPETIALAAKAVGMQNRITIYARSPADVPEAVRQLDALVMFFQTGLSKLGSCPTRMAEALASGVPVVTNAGVGDVATIVRENRVGVIVQENSAQEMVRAAIELQTLFMDQELAQRCRKTAEEFFSVKKGADSYNKLYADAAADRL